MYFNHALIYVRLILRISFLCRGKLSAHLFLQLSPGLSGLRPTSRTNSRYSHPLLSAAHATRSRTSIHFYWPTQDSSTMHFKTYMTYNVYVYVSTGGPISDSLIESHYAPRVDYTVSLITFRVIDFCIFLLQYDYRFNLKKPL